MAILPSFPGCATWSSLIESALTMLLYRQVRRYGTDDGPPQNQPPNDRAA